MFANIQKLFAAMVAACVIGTASHAVADDANKAPPPAQKPEMTVDKGVTPGTVAPTAVFPLSNGGRFEVRGPDLHPQMPIAPSGSMHIVVPIPEWRTRR